MFLADVTVFSRLYRDGTWSSLGECRLRLQSTTLSLEVHDPNGPYCLDLSFDKIHLEIEEASYGHILFITLNIQERTITLEIRGNSAQVNALVDAIWQLE